MARETAPLHVGIQGELTIATSASTKNDLLEALDHGSEVNVDLSRVTEIDSAGIQILVAAKREATARAKTLRFVAQAAPVAEVLELLGLMDGLCDAAAQPGA